MSSPLIAVTIRPEIGMTDARRARRAMATIAVLLASLSLSGGCDDEAALRAFRDTAASGLQSGFKTILTGVIEGAFAAGADASDGATTSTDSADSAESDAGSEP